jgi:multiphosphoryl transfer protein
MQQLELVIQNTAGLHARPARVLVDLAKQFQSAIYLSNGKKRVNGKSLIAVLTLGVTCGQALQIDVSGDDEETAAAALAAAVRDRLGEGHDEAQAEAVSTSQAAPPAVPTSATTPVGTTDLLQGVSGAPGLAVGPIFRFERPQIAISAKFAGVEQEQARLDDALAQAREHLIALQHAVAQRADTSEASIFAVHCELLADPDLLASVRTAIGGGRNAAQAWQAATVGQAAELAQLSDALLAERAADLRDVGERVLRLLTDEQAAAPTLPNEPVIVVAADLTPSETAAFDPNRVLGFCTAVGGPNAHTAILARALGLPAVVGAGQDVLALEPGTLVVLDGAAGTVHVRPDAPTLERLRARQRYEHDQRAAACSADAVGLLRTEFLFLERTTAPSEDEQFAVYRDIAVALDGRPLIIRTLDIGGDKPLPYLKLPVEDNPFLGERGIRLCLAHPELLRQQLRAILRAAHIGPLRIMFPMVADHDELCAARAIVAEVQAELGAPPVELGIMVEVPSAALMADLLAPAVDFFSIGTNDLTQYTLAMDRTHPTLAAKADGLHPAVLRLIGQTAEAAHAAGKWVGVCGELAADPVAVPILVGLGVDELSVSVPAVPVVKAQIRSLTRGECQQRAREALACATAQQVREGARQPYEQQV